MIEKGRLDLILSGSVPVEHFELGYLSNNYKEYDIRFINTSEIEDFAFLFYKKKEFNVDISRWDVSSAKTLAFMFYDAINFNQDISGWNVGNCTLFSSVFSNAKRFNQNLNNWDMSKATCIRSMFSGAESFNSPINKWNMPNLGDLEDFLLSATNFNQSLAEWSFMPSLINERITNEKKTIELSEDLFRGELERRSIESFWKKQEIETRNYFQGEFRFLKQKNVCKLNKIDFEKAIDLHSDLFSKMKEKVYEDTENVYEITEVLGYNILKVVDRYFVLSYSALEFLQEKELIVLKKDHLFYRGKILEITEDVLKGIVPVDLDALRYLARNNKKYDLTKLNTINITCFSCLFTNDKDFNQDISNWNVSNGINFSNIFFKAESFNQPIGKWDMSSAENLNSMLCYAISFNKNIEGWDLSNANDITMILKNAESYSHSFRFSSFLPDVRCVSAIDHIKKPIEVSANVFSKIHISEYFNALNMGLYCVRDIKNFESKMVLFDKDAFVLNYRDSSLVRKEVESIVESNAVIGLVVIDENTLYVMKVNDLYYRLKEDEYKDFTESELFDCCF